MVSLSVIVILPPFSTFSHGRHFQLNCYSIHDAAHYPQSTRQIRAHCCHRTLASRVERRVMVSFPVLFIFPPHHSKHFLTASFSNEIAILSAMPAAFPQSARQIRARRCHPLLTRCVEKAVTVSSSLIFIFPPPIRHLFSQILFPI
jgi:hypothetical protein